MEACRILNMAISVPFIFYNIPVLPFKRYKLFIMNIRITKALPQPVFTYGKAFAITNKKQEI
jgi:hypothetical protein